jgi:Type IV minor pilin ComP, DNA uptake sequence receptor
MKSMVGLIISAAIGLGIYMYTLKQASPGPGMVVTQNISIVGVKNDLISIAQAERMYYAENSTYADLATLNSTGAMSTMRSSRDGYTYSVETSGSGFTVTATYTPPIAAPAGVTPPHFPTYSIDQTMEVHQED